MHLVFHLRADLHMALIKWPWPFLSNRHHTIANELDDNHPWVSDHDSGVGPGSPVTKILYAGSGHEKLLSSHARMTGNNSIKCILNVINFVGITLISHSERQASKSSMSVQTHWCYIPGGVLISVLNILCIAHHDGLMSKRRGPAISFGRGNLPQLMG